ncbi:ABC transporter substrate-binding protein [Oceanivirga salmonicida]|uniref:ABC transporter substrate-binding protein n=1 Tax=Oceanivirga salmonicida TaxID=1769291 RepID=UPI000829F965|nr:ABC transporter substrate-binding protein [Oceanivirga salmonicida]
MKKLLSICTMLLLFSCGSSENEKINENKNELKEITFVLDWTPNTNHTGIYVAKEKGLFEEYGLKVNIVQPSEDSSSTIVAVGKAEFGVYFQPNMIKKLEKNMPITAIAAIIQHNTAGLLTLKSLNTKSPKDLEKLRYATWEDAVDDATVKDLVGENINPVPFGDVTDPIGAMKHNLFDYLISYYAWDGINAKIKNEDIDFYFFKDFNKDLDYYSPVIIANNEFIKNNPEITKNFLKAAKQGYEFAIKNPNEAADILIKYAPESDPKLIKASQEWISQHYVEKGENWGEFDIQRWDNFFKWVYDNKLIDKPFPSSYGVTNEYIK